MTGHDKPAFLRVITAMAEMYQRDCSTAVIDLYFRALSDLAIEQVEAAVVSLLKTAKFMPRPAEIREAIEGPAPKTSPAERAWARLLDMVAKLNQCNLVECEDPALGKALEVVLGHWSGEYLRQKFDSLDEMGRAVLRKDFCAAYENAVAEGVPTSGRCVLRWPQGSLSAGCQFALGISDKRGVRVYKFADEAKAVAWRKQAALPPAPTSPLALAERS